MSSRKCVCWLHVLQGMACIRKAAINNKHPRLGVLGLAALAAPDAATGPGGRGFREGLAHVFSGSRPGGSGWFGCRCCSPTGRGGGMTTFVAGLLFSALVLGRGGVGRTGGGGGGGHHAGDLACTMLGNGGRARLQCWLAAASAWENALAFRLRRWSRSSMLALILSKTNRAEWR